MIVGGILVGVGWGMTGVLPETGLMNFFYAAPICLWMIGFVSS